MKISRKRQRIEITFLRLQKKCISFSWLLDQILLAFQRVPNFQIFKITLRLIRSIFCSIFFQRERVRGHSFIVACSTQCDKTWKKQNFGTMYSALTIFAQDITKVSLKYFQKEQHQEPRGQLRLEECKNVYFSL